MRFVVIFLLFFATQLEASKNVLAPLVDYLAVTAHNHSEDCSAPIPIVAIGGCSGVGKTYLTNYLLRTLQKQGVRCISLSIDHFLCKNSSECDLNQLKVDEIHSVLTELHCGAKVIEKPLLNQRTGEISYETLYLADVDLILFDGPYALCTHTPINFFQYCQAGIFLEADEFDICAWKWEKEQKKRKPRSKEQFAAQMDVIFEDFKRNIAYTKKNAIFIIKKESNHQCHLDTQNPDVAYELFSAYCYFNEVFNSTDEDL